MAVFKWVREELEKYSFIDSIVLQGATVVISYKHGDKIKKKMLPYRADKNQVIKIIKSIKKEIGYDEDREARIKRGDYDTKEYRVSNFVYSHD